MKNKRLHDLFQSTSAEAKYKKWEADNSSRLSAIKVMPRESLEELLCLKEWAYESIAGELKGSVNLGKESLAFSKDLIRFLRHSAKYEKFAEPKVMADLKRTKNLAAGRKAGTAIIVTKAAKNHEIAVQSIRHYLKYPGYLSHSNEVIAAFVHDRLPLNKSGVRIYKLGTVLNIVKSVASQMRKQAK